MAELKEPKDVEEVREGLGEVGYLADESSALVSFLAQRLGKPVLVEGPAGVGKTELAKALARATGRELIRLQCYEGLDEAKALYEWNYRKQLLRIQAEASAAGNEVEDMRLQLVESAKSAFYDYFLVARALEINEENLNRLKEFKDNAETRYKNGLAPQQDVLQADVEFRRMDVYERETRPLLEHYPAALRADIDARKRPFDVLRLILEALAPVMV